MPANMTQRQAMEVLARHRRDHIVITTMTTAGIDDDGTEPGRASGNDPERLTGDRGRSTSPVTW